MRKILNRLVAQARALGEASFRAKQVRAEIREKNRRDLN